MVMKTTLHTVLCMAIRLGAVLMLVGIVEQAPSIFLYPSQGGEFSAGALWLSGAGVLLAFTLWLWPNTLAWWATSRSQHEVLESPINADQIQHVAFSVIGMWLFISGVTGCLARVVMMLVVFRHSAYGDSTRILAPGDWYWLVEHLTTAAAGAWLALGSRGLVRLLGRLRGYPYSTIAKSDPDITTTHDG
jgi:hypothetical protein